MKPLQNGLVKSLLNYMCIAEHHQHLIKVNAGANSTYQIMNCHASGFSEELDLKTSINSINVYIYLHL